jgi:hypothetical protein
MNRSALPILAALLLAGVAARPARPDEARPEARPTPLTARELTEEGRNAIVRGLAWLAGQQQANGSWIANVGFKRNDDYVVTKADTGHPGVTALAGMAFLAGGHVPGRGIYGDNVKGAVRYVLSTVNDDGMITANGTRMYSHAFGTLFLAEVYGMTRDAEVRRALQKATQFTWQCQNEVGGWRYVPFDRDSDMSITVCQVMALRAARNVGIRVPKESIDRAVNYVLMSANTGSHPDAGSFRYRWRPDDDAPTRSTFSLTAAGLATLFMAGLYTDEDILAHIRKNRIERFTRAQAAPRISQILTYLDRRYGTTKRNHYYFFYGNYYAVQAMFIAGGKWWEDYFARVQADLVRAQRTGDGSWPIAGVGDTYATACACIILQVPYRYLPIFER